MEKVYTVEIRKETQSRAIILTNVVNSYTKGELYCVRLILDDGSFKTRKYPLCGIFDIVEHEPNNV